MANEKISGAGQFKGNPEDAAHLARAMASGEADRRINDLEKSIRELQNSQLDRHAKLITIIFSCMTAFVAVCAILVTILGILSKSETREAVKDMKLETKEQMAEMQSRFQALAGEALKKPLIEISCNRGLLDGQEFEIARNASLPLFPLFLKNGGNKKTDSLSIRLFMSTGAHWMNTFDWVLVTANDKDYPISYYAMLTQNSRTAEFGISPKETWTMQPQESGFITSDSTNVINCKIQVFYGAESPAEAKFLIKFKP